MPSRSKGPAAPAAPSAILHLSSLSSLLDQLTSPEGSPHTALLCYPSGAVIASSSVPTVSPWPSRAFDELAQEGRERSASGRLEEEEAVRTCAAVGCSSWEEERGEGGAEELVMDTWLGRMEIAKAGALLLVLVGHHAAPWPVLHKKLTLAVEVLKDPLSKVAL